MMTSEQYMFFRRVDILVKKEYITTAQVEQYSETPNMFFDWIDVMWKMYQDDERKELLEMVEKQQKRFDNLVAKHRDRWAEAIRRTAGSWANFEKTWTKEKEEAVLEDLRNTIKKELNDYNLLLNNFSGRGNNRQS